MANASDYEFVKPSSDLALAAETLMGQPSDGLHRRLLPYFVTYAFSEIKEEIYTVHVLKGLAAAFAQVNVEASQRIPSIGVVVVDRSRWNESDSLKRHAMMDEALSRFEIDNQGRLSVKRLDIETFASVVARRGMWNSAVELVFKAVGLHRHQLPIVWEEAVLRDDDGRIVS